MYWERCGSQRKQSDGKGVGDSDGESDEKGEREGDGKG